MTPAASELTPEQQAIVADRSRDILVSAGAGSGKTRVLVERYLSLLTECRIPQIAAVTFTDAAATEMRDRVRRAVRERPELTGHRRDLDQAVIGTLHALCRQILREHPVEAGTIAAGRILADDEAEHERVAAALDALEDAAQSRGERARALRELGVYQITEQLPRMVERRDEVRDAFDAIPGASADDRERRVRALLEQALADAVAGERPNLVRAVAAIREQHAAAAPGDALAVRVREVLAALGTPLPQEPRALVTALAAARPLIHLGAGSARNWQDLDRVKDDLRTVRAIAERLEAAPRWRAIDRTALEVTEALRAVFDDACRRYEARKAALDGCDYLDLEIEAIRLLRGHPQIAARLRRRFRHVMVDEVQDVNQAQITLLRLLTDGAGPRPNRFLVGDAKQAIYRFRGSDVAHFVRFRQEIRESGGGLHALTRSFRTHDELVSAANTLFTPLFADRASPDRAGPDRSGPHAVPMQRMSGRGPAGRPGPHLIVVPIDKRTADGAVASEQDRRRVEADAVAGEIAALLRGGDAPRDVAILLRRLANVHAFEQALESHGVPYGTPAGAGFFTRQEVRDLTNLLAWLAEPDDRIALAGVLRSPLFMLDDRTLLRCHASGSGWLQALKEPPDGVDGGARQRCIHAAAVLRELRRMAPVEPADAIVEAALALTGFEAAWAAVNGGEQALANVRKLVAVTRDLAGRSIDEVVAYLRRRRDELADREGLAVIDQTDAVRILTVHGAKGLEFPIVFVPEAHVRAPERYEPVRWRPADGIAVTLVPGALGEKRRQPGFYRYLRDLDRGEDDAEYRRLLYVAATRAADRLYLSGEAETRPGTWLEAAGEHLSGMAPNVVEVRRPAPVDVDAIAAVGAAAATVIPPAAEERPVTAPLVERPAVIPLRSSTPVTALRSPEPAGAPGPPGAMRGHGDGMGRVRGSLAHEAIRLWFTAGRRPALTPVLSRLQPAASESDTERVLAEVEQMLDRFDGSELAQTLRRPGARFHFELSFGWYWDGAPVHGTIDLAYEHAGRWHLVDFKTDDVPRGRIEQAAAPYLGQIALYAGALQQAVGHAPAASLHFLRTGASYHPGPGELRQALAATRSRVDAGPLLATGADTEEGAEADGAPDTAASDR